MEPFMVSYLVPPPTTTTYAPYMTPDGTIVPKATVLQRTYLGDVKVRVLSPRLVRYDNYTTADYDEFDKVVVHESFRLGCRTVRSWYTGRTWTFTVPKPPTTVTPTSPPCAIPAPVIEAVKRGTADSKEAKPGPPAVGPSASTLFESGQTDMPESPASGSRRPSVSGPGSPVAPRRASQPQLPPVPEQALAVPSAAITPPQQQPEGEGEREGAGAGASDGEGEAEAAAGGEAAAATCEPQAARPSRWEAVSDNPLDGWWFRVVGDWEIYVPHPLPPVLYVAANYLFAALLAPFLL